MFYPKNVPNIERALRVIAGILLVAVALFGDSLIGPATPVRTGLLIFSAIFLVLTGFIGWCPACAVIGRKLKTTRQDEAY